MGKNKFTRVLALCLAVVCLATVVAAVTFDRNNDGKTNSWDLQLAVNEGETALGAAIAAVLGGKDELTPNADGVYEIYSAVGIFNMAKHRSEGATFKLMKDVDMGGAVWTPIVGFLGHLDGQDHTLSNFKMTESKNQNLGLFADTVNFTDGTQSTITNLHLENVQIVLGGDEDARYIGTLVGTNRAKITDCTAVCTVIDQRTKLAQINYVGTLVGRNATQKVNNVEKTLGVIAGANELTVSSNLTAKSQWVDTQKVNSKMATFFAELEEGSSKRYLGVAGFSRSDGINTSLLWQDISNSTALAETSVQQVRETVTNTMYEMCTVEWTPSQTLKYYRYDGRTDFSTPASNYYAGGIRISGKWYEGGYYRGLPYNHGSSGMDRFLAYMEEKNGIYTTVESLPTEAYYVSVSSIAKEINAAYAAGEKLTASGYTVPATMTKELVPGAYSQIGYNMYIGTDCSSQAAWAWRSAIAASTNLQGTAEMFPTAENIKRYGYQSVNGLVFETITTDLNGNGTSNDSGDREKAATNAFQADKQLFWDALAATSKGDCLMHYTTDGGHTRMAIGDAVVIYKFNSKTGSELDLNKSYIVTAEQGGGGHANYEGTDENGKRWRSTCCVDRMTTFADMTGNIASPWIPITCNALKNVDTAATTATCKLSGGKVTSNFHIVSTTVNGETVYTGIAQSGHRNPVTTITLANVHKGITAGDTVTVKLANGETYEFTY